MSQISMPIRIVAIAALALIAAYMTVLRPKSETPATPAATPATTPAGNVHTGKPAVTQFGKAVQEAQGAAKAEENQAKANAGEATSPSTGSTSSSSDSATKSGSASATKSESGSDAASAPAADVSGLPKPVRRAVHRHQVMALLFWNGRSADDRAVRSALRHVEHYDGTVYTHAAPIRSIARYGRIARGVDVQQSPTVVVVDRKLNATSLVGFVDTETIDQSVLDALRATGGIFKDHYLARVNGVCSTSIRSLNTLPEPVSVPQAKHYVGAYSARFDRFVARFAGVDAPKKWRSLRAASLTNLRAIKTADHGLLHTLSGHPTLAAAVSAIADAAKTEAQASKRFNHRMQRHGVVFCGPTG